MDGNNLLKLVRVINATLLDAKIFWYREISKLERIKKESNKNTDKGKNISSSVYRKNHISTTLEY
eukprot:snap_masked-scaffold_7-processed-gene-5.35-mRNA-1 protein AED:1.00 eAED:1.00 QI:0/-1/0/0/-1/1/1/0/64